MRSIFQAWGFKLWFQAITLCKRGSIEGTRGFQTGGPFERIDALSGDADPAFRCRRLSDTNVEANAGSSWQQRDFALQLLANKIRKSDLHHCHVGSLVFLAKCQICICSKQWKDTAHWTNRFTAPNVFPISHQLQNSWGRCVPLPIEPVKTIISFPKSSRLRCSVNHCYFLSHESEVTPRPKRSVVKKKDGIQMRKS